MRDERIHIVIDGDDLFIAIDPRRKPSAQSVAQFESAAFVAEFFRLLETTLTLTASGEVTLAMEGLTDRADRLLTNEWTLRTQPIDTLAETMIHHVLAAPDKDDITALDQCLDRFDVARKTVAQARQRLRDV